MKEYYLYLDDSGTRHPDHAIGRAPAHGHDWFAFGGIILKADDETVVRERYRDFCANWNIEEPLHSSEIRSMAQNFHWLNDLDSETRARFYEELYQLMAQIPVLGTACVIDRPGYNTRYTEQYGRQRWRLCKTAFAIVLDRSAKFARSQGGRLRVWVERSSKKDDSTLKQYFADLRSEGLPFSDESSNKYQPLSQTELATTLHDLKFKVKTSPMVQLADLFTWPMCIGGYDKNNRPFRRLLEDKRLIDCEIDDSEIPRLGIKYSCFDGVETQKPA